MIIKCCRTMMIVFAMLSFLSIAIGNITLGIATLCFLLCAFQNRNGFHTVDRTYYAAIAVFMATMLISALGSGDIRRGLCVWSDFWFWRLMPFFILTTVLHDASVSKKVFGFSLMGIGIGAIHIMVQGFEGLHRAAGFFGHPMTFAGYLCVYLPILFVLFFEKRLPTRWRQVAGGLFVICAFALLFNATRGAWLSISLVISLLLLYYLLQRRKLAICVLCAFLVTGAALSQYEPFMQRMATITDTAYQSNTERLLIWKSAVHMFRDHPVVGVGLGQYRENYQKKYISPEAKEPEVEHAHNSFLQMAAENGTVGLVGFLVLLSCFVGVSFRRFLKEKNPYALMMCVSTLCLALQGLTEYNFGNSAVMKCFWLTEGYLLVLSHGWSDSDEGGEDGGQR